MITQQQARDDLVAIIASELAAIDGFDPNDRNDSIYAVQWSGGPASEPLGDEWSINYLPKGERIAAAILANEQHPDAPPSTLEAVKITAQQQALDRLGDDAVTQAMEAAGLVSYGEETGIYSVPVPAMKNRVGRIMAALIAERDALTAVNAPSTLHAELEYLANRIRPDVEAAPWVLADLRAIIAKHFGDAK